MADRAAIILAAGQGTRMKSSLPKMLHKVGGRTLLDRAIDTVEASGCEKIVVVVGANPTGVSDLAAKRLGEGALAVQSQPNGTAKAALAAEASLADFQGDVLVINGDCPLLQASDLDPLFALRAEGAALAIMAFKPTDGLLYGRVVSDEAGGVLRIVEPKEASPRELKIETCNGGMYCADRAQLFAWLSRVSDNNAKREYYITDIVAMATDEGKTVRAHLASESAIMGADTPAQLAQAEAIFQTRARVHHLTQGAVMTAPETVYFSWDTKIAPGVQIEPFVVFAPGVSVETGAVIRAFSHLEGASVASGALIGPYARLRPGAEIGPDAHIGNFVEVKKVKVGAGAKANHLAYLGDGTVGPKANIGAGTIFCNYDGFDKWETHIGAGAFIGSNTSIVAPRTIGAGAMTGSGSVITTDVPDNALALERTGQVDKPGWAAAFRARKLTLRGAK